MENTPHDLQHEIFSQQIFLRLISGLNVYLKTLEMDTSNIPYSLRDALNALVFAAPRSIPTTLYHFIQLAHTPLSEWYPDTMLIPNGFDPTQPLLYQHRLSEEAQEFHLDLLERLQISSEDSDISQTALDNLPMHDLRMKLRTEPNQQMAQQLYEKVRLFLIQNSWAKQEQFRALSPNVQKEVRVFYEDMPDIPVDMLQVCQRCGLLVWRDGRWQGIKPHYCSDHAEDSAFIQSIRQQPQLYRLTEGAHLRTFIPGRIELALFEFTEEMQATYSDRLLNIEKYPGIDTYDLRLTFRGEEVWAVDAKDQAYPKRLAQQIRLPYGEGNLTYNHAFFVIPDKRLEEDGYWEALNYAIGSRPNNLEVMTLSGFKQRVQDKLNLLAKPTRPKKRNFNKTSEG